MDTIDKNSYYTPSIEGFHVGFEYERLSVADIWTKLKIQGDDINAALSDYITKGIIRVKYLDKEDIESFGFSEIHGDQRIFFGEVGFDFFKEITHNMYHIVYHNYKDDKFDINHHLCIDIHNSTTMKTGENASLFKGNILNKSEFAKLLKQLHVYESK